MIRIFCLFFFSLPLILPAGNKIFFAENFESDQGLSFRPMHVDWASVTPARVKINYAGRVDSSEVPFTGNDLGKHAFKLDVTMQSSAQWLMFVLRPEKPIRLTEKMRQSGYLYVKENSGLRVAFGTCVTFDRPPEKDVSCVPGKWGKLHMYTHQGSALPTGWNYTDVPIGQRTKWYCANEGGARKISFDNSWFGGILIQVLGKIRKGDRIVVYADNVMLSEGAPSGLRFNAESAAQYRLLGPRARYEVRNKLYFQQTDGNALKNASFELGMNGWGELHREKTPGLIQYSVIDGADAFHGGKFLRITHKNKAESILVSEHVMLRADGRYPVSFHARANGDFTVAGQKISDQWTRFRTEIFTKSKPGCSTWTSDRRTYPDHRFVYLPVSGKGVLEIDAVRVAPEEKTYRTLPEWESGISFQNDERLCNVFFDGESITANLHYFNGSKRSGNVDFVWAVRDFFGRNVQSGNFRVDVNAGSGGTESVKLPATHRGIYSVYLRGKTEHGEVFDSENVCARIRRLDSAALGSGTLYGLCHPGFWNLDRILELSRISGVKSINMHGVIDHAHLYEKKHGNWREDMKSGRFFDRSTVPAEYAAYFRSFGMEPFFMMRGLPSWMSRGQNYSRPGHALSSGERAEYRDLSAAFVRNLLPEKMTVELWPEVINAKSDAAAFTPVLKAAVEGIRAGNPGIEVIGCGFYDVSAMARHTQWAEELGWLKFLDGVSVHPYAGNPDTAAMDRHFREIRRILDRNGTGKSIYATEVGYQNLRTFYADLKGSEIQGYSSVISEEHGADFLARMYFIALANRVRRLMFFPAMSGGLPHDPFHFGIVNADQRSPKAAFAALAAVNDQFHDASPFRPLRLTSGMTGYVYRRARGDAAGVLWNYSAGTGRTEILFPAGEYRFVDLMNNPVVPERFPDGRLRLELDGGSPLMIFASRAETLASALGKIRVRTLNLEAVLDRTKEGKSRLFLKNSTAEKRTVDLRFLRKPEGWNPGRIPGNILLEPGKSVVFELPEIGDRASLEMECRSGELLQLLKLRPFFCPLIRKESEMRELEFRPDAIRWYGTPGRERVTAEDFSVRFFCGYDRDFLHLRFEVRDDRFHQPYSEEMIWRGDSIQLAFDPRRDPVFKLDGNYRENDLELGIARLGNGRPHVTVFHGDPSLASRIPVEIRQTGTQTSYRIRIPWSVLGVNPLPGALIGFNFTANDNDGKGNTVEKFYGLTAGIAEKTRKVPYFFSDLLLLP